MIYSSALQAEFWIALPQIRLTFDHQLSQQVLADICATIQPQIWTRATGFKAFFAPLLQCLKASNMAAAWSDPPICTSIVLQYWQRYLMVSEFNDRCVKTSHLQLDARCGHAWQTAGGHGRVWFPRRGRHSMIVHVETLAA
ncbi:unnamed protein product [Symbiodinium natans]|uniref:Uncharacterized protein n=1 Tax=Symbiodinium natans TaxID=878477 RepID=A0A812MV13_9DINO|nr:unnamed protein product [Symbiodinium natans]